jgi:hypothetical protein
MQEKNNKLVEEAFLQMKQVEEAIAENAKGILQSTMKEEISQLVKESLSEQDDEEMDGVELDAEMDTDIDDEEMDMDIDDEEMDADNEDYEEDDEMDFEMDMDSDESPIDLTDASDEEILKVFKAMGEDDGIIVKKDGEDIHLTDEDDEYLIKLGESEEDMYESYDELDEDTDAIIDAIFSGDSSRVSPDDLEEEDEVVYEIEMDDEELDEEEEEGYQIEEEEEYEMEDDIVYEIEMDDEELDEEYENDFMEYDDIEESYNPKRARKGEHTESKKSIKPKGVGIGKGPKKVNFKSNTEGGFNEKKSEAFGGKVKAVGTGNPKKDVFKKGENMDGKPKVVKKSETKEAARTLGNGKRWGRDGLDKPRTSPRHIQKESLEQEVAMLRQKNEEYRKALNVFREKLTEVAIFNSNLAYATRLFTEHSTTKKEKINILRRFDGVATLKESKLLYKSIKDQLSNPESKPINETVERKLNKTVSSGSSVSLIESKTYENPQFLRMKDLMGKLG